MKKDTVIWVCTCSRCTRYNPPSIFGRDIARIEWSGTGFTLFWHSLEPNYNVNINLLINAAKHWAMESVWA